MLDSGRNVDLTRHGRGMLMLGFDVELMDQTMAFGTRNASSPILDIVSPALLRAIREPKCLPGSKARSMTRGVVAIRTHFVVRVLRREAGEQPQKQRPEGR